MRLLFVLSKMRRGRKNPPLPTAYRQSIQDELHHVFVSRGQHHRNHGGTQQREAPALGAPWVLMPRDSPQAGNGRECRVSDHIDSTRDFKIKIDKYDYACTIFVAPSPIIKPY